VPRWPVATVFLVGALTAQALAVGTIKGKLTGPSGIPLEAARITATDANYKSFRGEASDDGTYSVEVDPGTYEVVVVGKGLESQVVKNVVVADNAEVEQNFPLEAAKPFCIIKADRPIPLTDDINSPSFADAPDIRVDGGHNVGEGYASINDDWKGPSTAGGRFRVKWSEQAIHLAADLSFAQPGVNFGAEGEQWKGNAIEFDFQDDAYDVNRDAYDTNHNWQLIVGIHAAPKWWLYGALQQAPEIDGVKANIADHLLIKDRNGGNLVRLDIPWKILLREDKKTAVEPPKEGAVGALDLVIDNSGTDTTADAATRQFQLSWSGFNTGWQEPRVLKPVQFCPKP
jgi:hypothetical protein